MELTSAPNEPISLTETVISQPISIPPMCPKCHQVVRASDYFCFNCGKNLHPKPPDTGITAQILLYLGSLFLPPMGIIWGIKYFKQNDTKSRLVGLTAMILTLVIIIITIRVTTTYVDSLTKQFDSLQNYGTGGLLLQ